MSKWPVWSTMPASRPPSPQLPLPGIRHEPEVVRRCASWQRFLIRVRTISGCRGVFSGILDGQDAPERTEPPGQRWKTGAYDVTGMMPNRSKAPTTRIATVAAPTINCHRFSFVSAAVRCWNA